MRTKTDYPEFKNFFILWKIKTMVVSEIRTATLLWSENEYLKYPVKVILHVRERGVSGELNNYTCTVSTGGPFVTARGAILADISRQLPYKYQQFNPIELYKKLFN